MPTRWIPTRTPSLAASSSVWRLPAPWRWNRAYLLFDEPTSALDPELEAEVIRVLMQLAKEGRSLVIVTHNMAFAKKVADRIVFLENGTLRYNGEPTGFFASDDERIRKFLTVYDSTEYTI